MAFHSPMSPSSSALSAHQPSPSQHHLHPRLHPSRLSLLRSIPLRLRLRIPRPQLPPLPLALPSTSSGNNNNGDNNDGGDGGGGDGEAEGSDGGGGDGEAEGSDGGANRGEALFVLAQVGRKLETLPSEDDDAMDADEDTPAPDRPADCWAITKESLSTAQQQKNSMVMNLLNGHICPSPQFPALKVERPHAAASIGAIAVSSSGADLTLERLNLLKSLSPKNDLKFLKEFKVLYILLCVDKEFMPLADKIIALTTRHRVVRDLSNKKAATLKINDLDKLEGFLGWSWKDIQKKLKKIKKGLKFILYVKQKEQLVEAIEALHLDRLYLLDDTECDTVEGRCKVVKVGDVVR